MMVSSITKHAKGRIKLRVGKANPQELVDRVVNEGDHFTHFTGTFRRYLDKLRFTHYSEPIVYKGAIYFFKQSTLITMYQVPSFYKKYKPKPNHARQSKNTNTD